MDEDELFTYAKEIQRPYDLVKQTAELGQPACGKLCRRRRCHPRRRRADDAVGRRWRVRRLWHLQERRSRPSAAKAIVKAVTHYNDGEILAEISRNLGEAMVGINLDELADNEKMAQRGW